MNEARPMQQQSNPLEPQVAALKEIIVQQAANLTDAQRQAQDLRGQVQLVAQHAQQLQAANEELRGAVSDKQKALDERMQSITRHLQYIDTLRSCLQGAGVAIPTPPAANDEPESEGGEAA